MTTEKRKPPYKIWPRVFVVKSCCVKRPNRMEKEILKKARAAILPVQDGVDHGTHACFS